jgi:protein tyrosine/serine phosphatase
MSRKQWSFVALLVLLSPSFAMAFSNPETYTDLAAATIPKFSQVSDSLFRGGRPQQNDLAQVQSRYGVSTVVDIENNVQAIRQERGFAAQLQMEFISEPMDWETRPSDDQVNAILDLLKHSNGGPVFIHCTHGEDRTGLIVGLYRVEVQGWTPEQAYSEMLQMGFHTKFKALDDYFRARTGYRGH